MYCINMFRFFNAKFNNENIRGMVKIKIHMVKIKNSRKYISFVSCDLALHVIFWILCGFFFPMRVMHCRVTFDNNFVPPAPLSTNTRLSVILLFADNFKTIHGWCRCEPSTYLHRTACFIRKTLDAGENYFSLG